MYKHVLLAAAAALTLLGAQAFAQDTKAPAPRSAVSMACSQQADSKGLHGKARKHFRSKCMRSMAKGKAKTQPPLGYR